MLSEEYKTLFKNDPLVAHIAENLSDFAEREIKEDSLISVIKRVMDALWDQIKAVDRVYDLFELAYHIVEKMDGAKVDNLTEMVRNNIMPFACLLDVIFRNKNVID